MIQFANIWSENSFVRSSEEKSTSQIIHETLNKMYKNVKWIETLLKKLNSPSASTNTQSFSLFQFKTWKLFKQLNFEENKYRFCLKFHDSVLKNINKIKLNWTDSTAEWDFWFFFWMRIEKMYIKKEKLQFFFVILHRNLKSFF